jgi:hypothetical protein
MSAMQCITRRIPLALAIASLCLACATLGVRITKQLEAENEAPGVATGLLSQRGMSPVGAVTLEGNVFTGYTCRALVGGAHVMAKASSPWIACVHMAYRPEP